LPASFPIVGIGASAGGIEALEAFFRALPADSQMAFVVVMHLARSAASQLPEILARDAPIPVRPIHDGEQIQPQNVYVLPPNALVTVKDGRLRLAKATVAHWTERPIDTFLTSLAEDREESAVGILLSGSGNDGAIGLGAIQRNGGLTLAQGLDDAGPRFPEMPQAAREMGVVDVVVPVSEMPAKVISLVREWKHPTAKPPADALTRIYDLLLTRTGHDFSQYKEKTFLRRVHRRMQVRQIAAIPDYVACLQAEPPEVTALFRDLLIGVTDFFRDPEAFEALNKIAVPKLFEGKGAGDEVRIWVPACASGEEAFSIAILLREHMETLATVPRVQIFATDIDENALTKARAARYPASALRQVSPARLKRFFVPDGDAYRLIRDIRDMCIFSAHSLIKDPPFSRLDLVSCRNLLIYLNADLQAQVIPIFHYALKPGGFLFLGASENLSRHGEMFTITDKKHRIFQRHDLVPGPVPMLPHFAPGRDRHPPAPAAAAVPARERLLRRATTTVLERFGPVYVIVDEAGEIVEYSAHTGRYLETPAGPPSRNLMSTARGELKPILRALLRSAKETDKPAASDRIVLRSNGAEHAIRLGVEPIIEAGANFFLVLFMDADVPVAEKPPVEPEAPVSGDKAVQQLELELKETKERLQSMIEELETANEELRSSNEELLSMNEELQSTNEELQTSKEELQSVNEELQTVNAELNGKIDEIDRANSDLRNIFESTRIATIFLDKNLVIRNFTPAVTAIFNLIPTDRGRPLTDIASRLHLEDLERQVRAVLTRHETFERRVRASEGGAHYLLRILPYRAGDNVVSGAVLTFIDITSLVEGEERQKLLTEELSHRVKNTLAVVSSIAKQTLKRSASLKDFSAAFQGRLQALALTHEFLSQNHWGAAPLTGVLGAVLAPYAGAAGRGAVALEGPDVALTPRAALTIGLAVHELATNAAKYGALSTPSGKVSATWYLKGRAAAKRSLEIRWVERGGPPVDKRTVKAGFGTDLIERSIAYELHGKTALTYGRAGLACTIAIPADAKYLSLGDAASARKRKG
jgi:two-component system, chemotaxis family, CheB/CheR fusion protein